MPDDKPVSSGTRLLDTLEKGLKSGDLNSQKAAAAIGSYIFDQRHGRNDTYNVYGKPKELNDVAKHLGLNDSEKNRLSDIVRTMYPKDRPLTASGEARQYGSERFIKADVQERERLDKLNAVTKAGTTFGSLLAAYVQASGGSAAQVKGAAKLGDTVQGGASVVSGLSKDQGKVTDAAKSSAPPRDTRSSTAATSSSGAGGKPGGAPPTTPPPAHDTKKASGKGPDDTKSTPSMARH